MDHYNSLTDPPTRLKKKKLHPTNKTIKILGVNNQKHKLNYAMISNRNKFKIRPNILQPTWSPASKIPLKLLWGRCDDGTWCYFDAWDWCWCSYWLVGYLVDILNMCIQNIHICTYIHVYTYIYIFIIIHNYTYIHIHIIFYIHMYMHTAAKFIYTCL